MDIDYIFAVTYGILSANWLVTIGVIVILCLLFWKKSKLFFNLTLALLVLLVVYYIIANYSNAFQTDSGEKKDYIHAPTLKNKNN